MFLKKNHSFLIFLLFALLCVAYYFKIKYDYAQLFHAQKVFPQKKIERLSPFEKQVLIASGIEDKSLLNQQDLLSLLSNQDLKRLEKHQQNRMRYWSMLFRSRQYSKLKKAVYFITDNTIHSFKELMLKGVAVAYGGCKLLDRDKAYYIQNLWPQDRRLQQKSKDYLQKCLSR